MVLETPLENKASSHFLPVYEFIMFSECPHTGVPAYFLRLDVLAMSRVCLLPPIPYPNLLLHRQCVVCSWDIIPHRHVEEHSIFRQIRAL